VVGPSHFLLTVLSSPIILTAMSSASLSECVASQIHTALEVNWSNEAVTRTTTMLGGYRYKLRPTRCRNLVHRTTSTAATAIEGAMWSFLVPVPSSWARYSSMFLWPGSKCLKPADRCAIQHVTTITDIVVCLHTAHFFSTE
jgi:hypothetical protein